MDVSYCYLQVIVVLGVLCGIPVIVWLAYWPPMRKACKYLFTDNPMTLGPLFSLALLAFIVFSGKAVVSNVRVVSCDGGTVAKTQQTTQVASVCTCGCGRHK